MNDDVRRAVLGLLGSRPTPARREQLATALEAEAERQRRIAAAERREQQRPAAERLTPKRGAGGRPSRPWVVIEERPRRAGEATEIRLKLSRALFDAAGNPAHLSVQRFDGRLVLTPGAGGYTIIANAGGVWINASGARDVLPEAGRYAAEVRGGAIHIGERLP
jgi:hypothetical protein